jgi:hypothetical protein
VAGRTREGNVDRRHHSPLSCFWLFNGEMFEKMHQGRRGKGYENDVSLAAWTRWHTGEMSHGASP